MNQVDFLVSLVGAERAPSFLAALTARPRHLLLVTSKVTQSAKDDIEAAIHEELPQTMVSVCQVPAFDLEGAVGELKRVWSERIPAQAHVIADVTGGTKPMSFGLKLVADANGARSWYVATQEGAIVEMAPGLAPHRLRLADVPSLHAYMRLYGFHVVSRQKKTRLQRQVAKWFVSDQRLAIAAITAAHRKEQQGGRPNDYVSLAEPAARQLVKLAHPYPKLHSLFRVAGGKVAIQKNWAAFLGGRWLEVYVSDALENLPFVSEVWTGVKIRRTPSDSGASDLNNELDSVARVGPRLVVVSCKTGNLDAKKLRPAMEELVVRARALGALTVPVLACAETAPRGLSAAMRNRAKKMGIHLFARKQLLDFDKRMAVVLGH